MSLIVSDLLIPNGARLAEVRGAGPSSECRDAEGCRDADDAEDAETQNSSAFILHPSAFKAPMKLTSEGEVTPGWPGSSASSLDTRPKIRTMSAMSDATSSGKESAMSPDYGPLGKCDRCESPGVIFFDPRDKKTSRTTLCDSCAEGVFAQLDTVSLIEMGNFTMARRELDRRAHIHARADHYANLLATMMAAFLERGEDEEVAFNQASYWADKIRSGAGDLYQNEVEDEY